MNSNIKHCKIVKLPKLTIIAKVTGGRPNITMTNINKTQFIVTDSLELPLT